MSSGGESLSYFPLSFKEALHLEVIYAGMGHQSQELRGSLFRLPVRMGLPVSIATRQARIVSFPGMQFQDSNLGGTHQDSASRRLSKIPLPCRPDLFSNTARRARPVPE